MFDKADDMVILSDESKCYMPSHNCWRAKTQEYNMDEKKESVFSTTDYDQFKFFDANRDISISHTARVAKSIMMKNLMSDFPILVDCNKYVLDGQHRLEACRKLKIPVYYKFAEHMKDTDIATINSISKKWTANDYLAQYISLGNLNYIRMNDFMRWAGIASVDMALRLFKYSCLKTTGGAINILFQEGRFEYPIDDSMIRSRVNFLRQLWEYLTGYSTPYDRNLVSFIEVAEKTPNFSEKRMIDQLKRKPITIKFSEGKDLAKMLQDTYNYGLKYSEHLTFNLTCSHHAD